jgi:nucleoside-diphosphate-sugar epimerase
MSKTIAIAGMGWLGRPLAYHLQTLGYEIRGSVTSREKAQQLERAGYRAIVMQVAESGISPSVASLLEGADVLLVMIPPGLRRYTGSDYVLKMTHLLKAVEASQIKKVVFVSSTSVYGDKQGKVDERDVPRPETEAGRQLLQAEQLFFTSGHFKATILRFGGLFGGSRQPVRYLTGRKGLRNGQAPVNLIHRDDCISIITEIIGKDAFGHIFNAVMPGHPTKEAFYTRQAKAMGLEPPVYEAEVEPTSYKEVHSINLDSILAYNFREEL